MIAAPAVQSSRLSNTLSGVSQITFDSRSLCRCKKQLCGQALATNAAQDILTAVNDRTAFWAFVFHALEVAYHIIPPPLSTCQIESHAGGMAAGSRWWSESRNAGAREPPDFMRQPTHFQERVPAGRRQRGVVTEFPSVPPGRTLGWHVSCGCRTGGSRSLTRFTTGYPPPSLRLGVPHQDFRASRPSWGVRRILANRPAPQPAMPAEWDGADSWQDFYTSTSPPPPISSSARCYVRLRRGCWCLSFSRRHRRPCRCRTWRRIRVRGPGRWS